MTITEQSEENIVYHNFTFQQICTAMKEKKGGASERFTFPADELHTGDTL
jgi:hypothetical protein